MERIYISLENESEREQLIVDGTLRLLRALIDLLRAREPVQEGREPKPAPDPAPVEEVDHEPK